MNQGNSSAIESLKKRIEMLISLYERGAAENIALKRENARLKADLEECSNKLKEKEEKLDKIVLANAFATSGENVKEARQKIARIVKEIDTCISLLNN